MKGYKKLKVFQLADQLVFMIYKKTNNFPKEELFGLTSQLKRAVLSIATNIVEGQAASTKKDFLRFLYIANKSNVEVEYLLETAMKLKYLSKEDYIEIEQQRSKAAALLNGLIRSIKSP